MPLERSHSSTNLGYTSTLLPTQLVRLMHQHMRAHSNVLGIRSTIRQTKYCVAFLESAFAFASQLFDSPAEFYSKNLSSLRWHRILAFSLKQVHSVQPKCLYFDQCFSMVDGGSRDVCDVEVLDRAFAVLDICRINVNLFLTSALEQQTYPRLSLSPCRISRP